MAIALALTAADAIATSEPASAREAARVVDIPPGPLSAGLARFSQVTGISVGVAGPVPDVHTRRVKGRMTPEAALRDLLRGTGLRARRIGDVYRLEFAPPALRLTTPRKAPPVPRQSPTEDIVVTAQKQPQTLLSVPLSVSAVSLRSLANEATTPSSRDISLGIEGLATTNLGPGRNRQFIRGVVDSPFLGKTQSTVAVAIDDARVTFDAPNPDLRLIDMERVEILKGPQGPLYGSGALGGIYHVVTRRPDVGQTSFLVRGSVAGAQHGGLTSGLETVINLPVDQDRLALRGVAYRSVDPGWIDNADGRRNSNSTMTAGARLALRWLPFPDWTVDAGITWQDIDARDSQYVLTNQEDLTRDNRLAEPTDNDFKMAHVTVEGRLGGLRLLSASSFVDQGFDYVLDASEAAAYFGLSGAARFEDNRKFTIVNQEVRLTPATAKGWLVGLSYMRATTKGRSTVFGDNDVGQTVERLDRTTTEYAVFGEASKDLLGRLKATAGARIYRSTSSDLATEGAPQRDLVRTQTLLSPSFTLSLPFEGRAPGIVYLRYARAKRPGGLAPADAQGTGQYDADKVNTVDLGFRRSFPDRNLSLAASVYATRWDRLQSDFLLPNGLVSTRNAGRASILGIEGQLEWRPGAGFSIAAGGAVQRARLDRPEDSIELDDRRLPVAPALTGRLSIDKQFSLGGLQGQAGLQANYIGSTVLSFDDDLDRRTREYTVLSAHSELTAGRWTAAIKLDNLLDIQGDSFAFGNPFSVRQRRQFTPIRPRYVSISLTKSW
jgi:outer membrane receptor protein involved in Fe transport